MSRFLEVPYQRLPPETLQALLEEYASRDGTDYGAQEKSLAEKAEQLIGQLSRGDLCLLFDSDLELWDILSKDRAASLLEGEEEL